MRALRVLFLGWKLQFKGDGADALTKADFVLKKGGLTVMKEGSMELTAGGGLLGTMGAGLS